MSFAAPKSIYDYSKYDGKYFLNGALSGGLCCSITHSLLCPVDVAKTRIQQFPEVYTRGLIGTMKEVVAKEGAGALATGLGPTAVGYFIQGLFKFGGFEFFKINIAKTLGDETAFENRNSIYLASSACAEFIADIFLCPNEAARIRSVSDANFGKGLGTMGKIAELYKLEGIAGWYSGFLPILFKQIPYTMAKFAVQGVAAEQIYKFTPPREELTRVQKMSVSIASGTIAGVAAAIISHPADTLLSKINQKGAGGEGGMMIRLGRLASQIGPYNLMFTGLAPRCVMIGTLTAGQFLIFDAIMSVTGVEKFHFRDPKLA